MIHYAGESANARAEITDILVVPRDDTGCELRLVVHIR